MSKIPIISFFSGAGFLDLGFEQAGFNSVWSNEYEPSFARIYSSGLNSWARSEGIKKEFRISNQASISDLKSEQIVHEAFGSNRPKLFGMIGGPPCQDFSINGKKNGFCGERGALTHIYIDKILEIKPTFFLMENVSGLVNLKKSKTIFNNLLNSLTDDYLLSVKKLNSINYGVPQSRERLIVVGFLKESFNDLTVNFEWPIIEKYENSLIKYDWPSVNEFQNQIAKPKSIPLELCVESCLRIEDDKTPNLDDYFNFRKGKTKRKEIKEGETNRPSFKRLHRFRYSPTTSYGNNEVHMHPYEDRRISAREALRIQGVPDTYVLPKNISLTKVFKSIGNGVPVPLGYNLAMAIKQVLDNR